jgi:hypothetical protein
MTVDKLLRLSQRHNKRLVGQDAIATENFTLVVKTSTLAWKIRTDQ